MVLVGVAAVAAAVAWVVVLLSPASQKPLSSATGDTVAGAPLTTLAGPENAVPGGGPGRRPLHGGAAGDHRARDGARSSASPWPRAAWSSRPPTSSAACGAS